MVSVKLSPRLPGPFRIEDREFVHGQTYEVSDEEWPTLIKVRGTAHGQSVRALIPSDRGERMKDIMVEKSKTRPQRGPDGGSIYSRRFDSPTSREVAAEEKAKKKVEADNAKTPPTKEDSSGSSEGEELDNGS